MPGPAGTPPRGSGGREKAFRRTVRFPLSVKPPAAVREAPWLKKLPDGREIISTVDPEGWHEYRERVRRMWQRQGGICCLSRYCPGCPGRLRFEDSVFEHEMGRGMGSGKRDDRIADSEDRPINGAAHYQCNRWKASLSIDYNRE